MQPVEDCRRVSIMKQWNVKQVQALRRSEHSKGA